MDPNDNDEDFEVIQTLREFNYPSWARKRPLEDDLLWRNPPHEPKHPRVLEVTTSHSEAKSLDRVEQTIAQASISEGNVDDEGLDETSDSEQDPLVLRALSQDQVLSNIDIANQSQHIGKGVIKITLRASEHITLVGQYILRVEKGYVSIMGAFLGPSAKAVAVYAASTHALPAIKHARGSADSNNDSVITVSPLSGGLRQMGRLNPAFRSLWNYRDNTHKTYVPVSRFVRLLRQSLKVHRLILHPTRR